MGIIMGDKEDLDQEGLFDKTETLTLNMEQATVIYMALNEFYLKQQKIKEISIKALGKSKEHREELQGDINLCDFTIVKILEIKPELETLIKSLDEDSEGLIQRPSWSPRKS